MNYEKQGKKVVVIGAGIVGASIAFRLAQRGATVTVVDAGEPGRGASVVSFAWINARDKNPRAYHDLNRRSLDMWDRFARELGEEVGLVWGGELRWAATAAGAESLAERVRMLQSWGYRIRLLDEEQVHRLEPGLVTGPVAAASYSTADGHVNPVRAIHVCLQQVTARGGEIRANTAVTGFELATADSGGREVVRVNTAEGDLAADAVVLAAGPDTPDVAALAGIEIPMRITFGASLITEPVAPLFEQVAVVQTASDQEPQVSFRQFSNGSVMIHGGGGATESGSIGRSEAEVKQLLAAAGQFVPALEGVTLREVRRGRRPIPQDGHPVLGFTVAIPNVYLATMHSGVTLAPLVGEFATLEILDGVRVDLLQPYRLERFAEADA